MTQENTPLVGVPEEGVVTVQLRLWTKVGDTREVCEVRRETCTRCGIRVQARRSTIRVIHALSNWIEYNAARIARAAERSGGGRTKINRSDGALAIGEINASGMQNAGKQCETEGEEDTHRRPS